MTRPSEDELIARYFAPIAGEAGLGLRDDAACYSPSPGQDLILTTDSLVETVHFLPDDHPASIARKALGVNVSDLAAKGAEPRGFLLNLALPDGWTEDWLASFARGLGAAAQDFSCPLLGGDTVRAAGPFNLAVTVIGEVPAGRMVRRTTASLGDLICVTGTIGDAALGLDIRTNAGWAQSLSIRERDFLADRYLHPQPRHALAVALRDHATAAMDISDGLAGDLAKMMRASGVSALVELVKVPLSPPAERLVAAQPALLDRLVTGGDDYEILFTTVPDRLDSLREKAAKCGIPISVIGQVVPGDEVPVFERGGVRKRYDVGSYTHF